MKKKNKKKINDYVSGATAIGLLILGFAIARYLDLPSAYLCEQQNNGLCAIPVLGKLLKFFSSPTIWFGFSFYGITFGGFIYIMIKRGYKF